MSRNDIFLRPGAPNPNDVILRVTTQSVTQDGNAPGDTVFAVVTIIPGVATGEANASGDVIEAQASIIPGKATGTTKPKDQSGGGVLHTPSFGKPLAPRRRKRVDAIAQGAVIEVRATIIPGKATGFDAIAHDNNFLLFGLTGLLMDQAKARRADPGKKPQRTRQKRS
jgi:hypothetical protein